MSSFHVHSSVLFVYCAVIQCCYTLDLFRVSFSKGKGKITLAMPLRCT